MTDVHYLEHRCPSCHASFRAVGKHGVCPVCQFRVGPGESQPLAGQFSLADLLGLLFVLQVICGAFYVFPKWSATIIAISAMAAWTASALRVVRPFSLPQLIVAIFIPLLVGLLVTALPILAARFVAIVFLAVCVEIVAERFEPVAWRYRPYLPWFWILYRVIVYGVMIVYLGSQF
jgi:hypothetical protein